MSGVIGAPIHCRFVDMRISISVPARRTRVCPSCKTWEMAGSVLIVDDHRGFRSWARQFLESTGYRVSGEAGDGGEAIRAARRERPDVVLLDVHLPDMNGFDVARLLADEHGHRPRVVLISSRSQRDLGHRIAESGAVGFIGKEDLTAEALSALLDGEQ